MSDRAVEILNVIGHAKVYDLGQPYWSGMPVHPADPPFQFFLYRYHEHTKKLFDSIAPGFSDSIGLLVTSMHAGTHFDTPIHMARDLKSLNQDLTKFEQDKGYVGLPPELKSVDQVPPLVKRGVLLDVAAYKGQDILPERYEITPEDLDETAKLEHVNIENDDCVLIRTGYSRFFTTDSDAYLHKYAGLGARATRWLAERKPSIVGIDNLAAGVPKPFEIHNILLSDHGIFMMKSLNLEELGKDKKYTSVVVVLPLKIRGGEASLVRPVAFA
ncbi:MAG TPA: cyclase family protein [Nitrososphaerales archaeon]